MPGGTSWAYDALGSAMAALNRIEERRTQAPPGVSIVAKNPVIPLDVWEERCRFIREQAQPRRKNGLSDYLRTSQPKEDEPAIDPTPAQALEQSLGAGSGSLLLPGTESKSRKAAPPRRKRITESVVLRARTEAAAKIVAALDPPLEEPFAGPRIPGELSPDGHESGEQKLPTAKIFDTAGPDSGSGVPEGFSLEEGLTFRGPYRTVTIRPHWTKAKEARLLLPAPRDVPRNVKQKHPYETRGARLANEDARRRLGDMLKLPSTLADHLSRNKEWLDSVPGGSLEIPSGRLNAKEFHPARSTQMQIPEANLRVR